MNYPCEQKSDNYVNEHKYNQFCEISFRAAKKLSIAVYPVRNCAAENPCRQKRNDERTEFKYCLNQSLTIISYCCQHYDCRQNYINYMLLHYSDACLSSVVPFVL